MKYCINCGTSLPPVANFCVNCGANLAENEALCAKFAGLDPNAAPVDGDIADNGEKTANDPTRVTKTGEIAAEMPTGSASDAADPTPEPLTGATATSVGAAYGKMAEDMGTSFGAPSAHARPTTEGETVFGSAEKYVDTRDYTPKPWIAVLSFLFWWLGLIIWSQNKAQRPGRANSALKGVLSFVCTLVPLAGLIMFIAWVKDRKDFARVAGISAIFGVVLGVFAYFGYIALIIAFALTA